MGYLDYKLRQSHEAVNGQKQLIMDSWLLINIGMKDNLELTIKYFNNPTFIVVNIILIEIL